MSDINNETATPLEQMKMYSKEKEKLLTQYKALETDLEYAVDDVEYGDIKNKRHRLATKIKTLGTQIRDIEADEHIA